MTAEMLASTSTVALVKKKFDEVGITILKEEVITAEKIDSDKLIDQHYYAIASKATIMKPAERTSRKTITIFTHSHTNDENRTLMTDPTKRLRPCTCRTIW